MTNLQNTLYVTTSGAWLRKDHENVVVRIERKTALVVPIHHLASIVCFGQVGVSPSLLHACGRVGVSVSFLSRSGRFLARMEGPGSGSVALRRAQYRLADDARGRARLARSIVAGKVSNEHALLLRGAREMEDKEAVAALEAGAEALRRSLEALDKAAEGDDLDVVRGHEGEAARTYFGAFDQLLRRREGFRFEGRTRRPPRDPMNALMSFLYALVAQDAASALQSVGLDPAVGYLHADRPGRPSLALDLAEELRAPVAERLAVALVNLRQVRQEGFVRSETGAVQMDDATRKAVLIAYQKKKQEPITHPFTGERATLCLAFFTQARLLARAVRGELNVYPPFVIH